MSEQSAPEPLTPARIRAYLDRNPHRFCAFLVGELRDGSPWFREFMGRVERTANLGSARTILTESDGI